MNEGRSILIVGGTFDPPHSAHVEIPRAVAKTIGCDEMVYVPTSSNPLKSLKPTLAHHRLAMLRLALRDCSHCSINTIEMDRPGAAYTVETLRRLREEYPESVRFRLLLGSDAVAEFHRWKEPRRILELAMPVVLLRDRATRIDLRRALTPHWTSDEVDRWLSWIVDAPRMDMSASDLRAQLARGEDDPQAIDPAVLDYIRANALYRAGA